MQKNRLVPLLIGCVPCNTTTIITGHWQLRLIARPARLLAPNPALSNLAALRGWVPPSPCVDHRETNNWKKKKINKPARYQLEDHFRWVCSYQNKQAVVMWLYQNNAGSSFSTACIAGYDIFVRQAPPRSARNCCAAGPLRPAIRDAMRAAKDPAPALIAAERVTRRHFTITKKIYKGDVQQWHIWLVIQHHQLDKKSVTKKGIIHCRLYAQFSQK